MPNVDDIVLRIRRVTEDLHFIQQGLNWAALQGRTQDEQNRVLDELLDPDLISDFKGSVDHMRHFLWNYIEETAKRSGKDLDWTLQTYRMRRAAEMLRFLRVQLDSKALAQVPEARSLFEEIHLIATSVVDRHSDRKAATVAAEPSVEN